MPFRNRRLYTRRMPRRPRRRFYRRRRPNFHGRNATVGTTRTITCPRKQIVRLRYGLEPNQFLQSTAGEMQSVRFSANNLFDPNTSGIGHQPRGFDQWMTLYDHYTVIGAKMVINFAYSTTGVSSANVGLCVNDGTAISSILNVNENRLRKMRTITPNHSDQTVVMSVAPHKYVGTKHALANDQLRGNASSGPSEDVSFHVFMAPIPLAGQSVYYTGYIDYIAILTEPKLPLQS